MKYKLRWDQSFFIELMLALIIFSLIGGIVVSVFVKAYLLRSDASHLMSARMQLQSLAENIRAVETEEALEQVLLDAGAKKASQNYLFNQPSYDLTLNILRECTELGVMVQCNFEVLDKNKTQPLAQLRIDKYFTSVDKED